ncbi:hypothetical protein, partial [Azospirillum brasilense]|uniref:hypothetical protein n=1 Tax=Azospirillum brasilense TaxID=192 RepID=UPI001A8DAE7C
RRRRLTSQQPFADGIATPAYDRTSVPKYAKSNAQNGRDGGTRHELKLCRAPTLFSAPFRDSTKAGEPAPIPAAA